jgi:WD40 repeat protein
VKPKKIFFLKKKSIALIFIPHSGTYVCISGTGHETGFLFGDADGITRKNITLFSKKSVTLTMHNSLVWSIAVSPYHGIIASTGSDGSVMVKPYSSDEYIVNPKHKVSCTNIFLNAILATSSNFMNQLKVLEYTLYKLIYDPDTQMLKYIDGLKPKVK